MRAALAGLAVGLAAAAALAVGPFSPPPGPLSGNPLGRSSATATVAAPPTIEISSPSAATHYVASASAYDVTGTATNASSVEWSNGGAWTSCTGTASWTCSVTPTANSKTITVRANSGAATDSFTEEAGSFVAQYSLMDVDDDVFTQAAQIAAGTATPTTGVRATTAMRQHLSSGTCASSPVITLTSVSSGVGRNDEVCVSSTKYRGARVEPAATNLLARSQEIDHAAWTRAVLASISANALAAPDGTTTADGLVPGSTNNANHQVNQSVSVTSGTRYTLSTYAVAGNQPSILLYQTTAARGWCFNVSTGSSVGTFNGGAGVAGSYSHQLGSGWGRAQFSYTAGATSSQAHSIYVSDDPDSCGATDHGFAGDDVTVSTYPWGAQLEANPAATSYVVTTASATRNADDLRYAAASNASTTAGTAEVWFVASASYDAPAAITLLSISDGTADDRVAIDVNPTGDVAHMIVVSGGASQASISGTTDIVDGAQHKIRVTWQSNEAILYVDGVQEGSTDTSVTVPASFDRISVGADHAAANQPIGIIPLVAIRDEVVTPAVMP